MKFPLGDYNSVLDLMAPKVYRYRALHQAIGLYRDRIRDAAQIDGKVVRIEIIDGKVCNPEIVEAGEYGKGG